MIGRLHSSWPAFRRLWAAQAVSLAGDQLTTLALPLLAVLVLHASPAAVGLLSASRVIPFLVGALVIGAYVDRMRRRPPLGEGAGPRLHDWLASGDPQDRQILDEMIAGDRDVGRHGASALAPCLDAGLVDEIRIQVPPIVLGGGVPLFDHLGALPVELERTRVVVSAAVTHLRLRVVRSCPPGNGALTGCAGAFAVWSWNRATTGTRPPVRCGTPWSTGVRR
jgi:hypothetical protein